MTRIARRSLAVALFVAAACAPAEDRPSTTASDPGGAAPVDPSQPLPPPNDTSAQLRWIRANACADQSPMSLTASDGTGLTLRSIKARAAIEGPIALTELHLSFDNPQDRQLEGRFSITLPPGAAISRFAMKIDGRWQEGEVVERQAARRAYEDFLHRRQDPALLENDAGNVFRARVFPIPARGQKELILAYSQSLAAEDEPWRLPLCGLPTLGELDVDVAIVRGAAYTRTSLGGVSTNVQHLSLREQNYTATQDLEAWPGKLSAQGVRHGDLAIARIKPVLADAEDPLTSMTILLDTSASRALDFTGQIERLGDLLEALAVAEPTLEIKLVAFDQELVPIYSGLASGFGEAEAAKLRTRGAMGASDLHNALQGLVAKGLVSPRILLMGDGVATAGETTPQALSAVLATLRDRGVQRLDAIVDGGIQDAALLKHLTRQGPLTDGIVLDARVALSSIVTRLNQATRSGIVVSVEGAEWVWPRTLDGVQPGDEVLVYAQLPGPDFTVTLEGAGLEDPSPKLSVVPGPLLGRAHAEARIADLQRRLSASAATAKGADTRTALVEQIVELSTRHRVLSDYTALLVLETEADYRRFNIERNALTDILTVGPSGVDLIRRAATPADPGSDGRIDNLKGERDKDWDQRPRRASATKNTLGPADMEKKLGGADSPSDKIQAPRGGAQASPESSTITPELGGFKDVAAKPLDTGATRSQGGAEARPPVPGRYAARAAEAAEEEAAVPRARPARIRRRPAPRPVVVERPHVADAWDGRFAGVMRKLAAGKTQAARDEATQWRHDQPGDVLALVALGEALEAAGNARDAARAYGSLIDLFPSRADLRRMAGERLERLGAVGLDLAADTYDKALQSRPDQPSGARLLAYAQVKQGLYREAFATLEAALDRDYPSGRFAQVHRILGEDLALVGKAWIAADGSADKTVRAVLTRRGLELPSRASTRFVLTWETDANDVDLHIYSAKGGHAYYSSMSLPSGGNLYADVTTGYGPECFTIEGKPTAGPYTLQAHYYRRGPMGYGMGKLQVLEHDGNGHLSFQDHPFVIMRDDAYVDLATVGR